MVEEVKKPVRKKPNFFRTDWHKHIKLGKTVKKSRKWRGAKGRQNKLRLNRKGHPQRPKIGWGAEASVKNFVENIEVVRVENVKGLENVKKGQGVIVASVGAKKRAEIIAKANELKFNILNKYRAVVSGGKE